MPHIHVTTVGMHTTRVRIRDVVDSMQMIGVMVHKTERIVVIVVVAVVIVVVV